MGSINHVNAPSITIAVAVPVDCSTPRRSVIALTELTGGGRWLLRVCRATAPWTGLRDLVSPGRLVVKLGTEVAAAVTVRR